MKGTVDLHKFLETASREELEKFKYTKVTEREELALQREIINAEMSYIESCIQAVSCVLKDKGFVKDKTWKDKLRFTDHALLRFIERSTNLSPSNIIRHIKSGLPDEIPEGAETVKTGGSTLRLAHDKNRIVVVTIVHKGDKRCKASRIRSPPSGPSQGQTLSGTPLLDK